jgi:hypothetical protein
MKMRVRKLSTLLVAGGLILGAAAAPAGADPKGETFELPCDNGQTYTVVVSEGGNEDHSKNDFTPAHIVSGGTIVPLSFGAFHGTITNSAGQVVDSFDDPATFKGQAGKNARNTVTCDVNFSETFVNPDDGMTYTFTGSTTVTGFVAPRNGA